MQRSSVDLPQPDGPITTLSSPRGNSNVRSLKMECPANDFVRPSILTTVDSHLPFA